MRKTVWMEWREAVRCDAPKSDVIATDHTRRLRNGNVQQGDVGFALAGNSPLFRVKSFDDIIPPATMIKSFKCKETEKLFYGRFSAKPTVNPAGGGHEAEDTQCRHSP